MSKMLRWSRAKKLAFLETLRQSGNVSAAAKAAGVHISKAYSKKNADKSFRLEWEAAMEGALDDLEEEVRRRALEGTKKPVYYAGKECGAITSFNDNLAMFLLKARRPEVYADQRVGGMGVEGNLKSPREKLLKKLVDMNVLPKPGEKV